MSIMQCQTEETQTIQSLPLNTESQDDNPDNPQLSELPAQQEQQPYPEIHDHIPEQINIIPQQTQLNQDSNLNDIEDDEDKHILLSNQLNDHIDSSEESDKSFQIYQQDQQSVNQQNYIAIDDSQYKPFIKSVEQLVAKNIPHQTIIAQIMPSNIQAYSVLNEDEEKSQIPVVCKLNNYLQIKRMAINESIIYIKGNNHIYFRNEQKQKQKNRKILSKIVSKTKKKQFEGE